MSLTAQLVAAHDAATSGKTYAKAPGAGETNCSVTYEDMLAYVYGERVRGERAALRLWKGESPWAPIDGAVRLGVAADVDEVQPGSWHAFQAWVRLPSGDDPGEGHTGFYWHPQGGGEGRILEANVRRPWDYTTTCAKRFARYKAGVRLAVLHDLSATPVPGDPMPTEKPPRTASAKNERKKATPKRRKKPAKTNPFANLAAKAFPKLNPKQMNRAARRLVLAFAEKDGLTGDQKHAAVAAELAKQLDALLVWPDTPAGEIAEALDGPSLQLLASFIVKHAHDALKGEGKIR